MYSWQIRGFFTKYGHDSRGFFFIILKKGYENTVFLREWTFFWQNIGTKALCFLESGRCFDNTWAWEQIFFVKNWKKRTSYWLFWPIFIIKCSFYRINVFLTKHRHDSNEFFMKNLDTMSWEHHVFERMDVFLRKFGNESIVFYFLREWTFFLTKYGQVGSYFYVKNWKKGHPLTFWPLM